MSRAVLSIGSNLADRLGHLRSVVTAVQPVLIARSAVYETAPWGPIEQDDFLNAVLICSDPHAVPADWLQRAHDLEAAAGRERDVRFGPRTLDVDVIAVDDVRSDDPVLTLPHPRAAERAFVLLPWLDADPAATLGGQPVAQLVAALPADERAGVRRRDDLGL